MFDFSHPFYKPLWRRIAIVGFCTAWALFEFVTGTPFWGMIFGGMGALCAYHFFIVWKD